MKNIALLLPLVTVLSLSACDNANNQIDTNPNAQSSENSDTQTDDTQINNNVNTPTDEKIADNSQATDTLVNNDTLEKDTLKNDALKKDTIEFLYRDTVLSYENNENVVDDLDTLFTYANKDLQNAIALVKADPLNTGDNYTNGMTDCNEVRYILKLDVGNGGSINQAADVKYKVLSDGKVRASIMLKGDEDIEASDFDNYKDFLLNCSSEGCKVADVFDSYGDSALQAADKACR